MPNRLPGNHRDRTSTHIHSAIFHKRRNTYKVIEGVGTSTPLLNNSATFNLLGIMSSNITDMTYYYNFQGADFPDLAVGRK